MAWNTFDEFAEVYQGDELDRFRRLTPGWAHQPETDDIIGFLMAWTQTLCYRQGFQ